MMRIHPMLFHEIEWQPASLCSYESTDNSFGGSVEAVAGGGGPGADFCSATGGPDGGGGALGAMGSGGFGLGGPGPMQTTAAEFAALGAIPGAGLGGAEFLGGWSGATLGMATAI